MLNKRARFINMCNSARSHMAKLAADDDWRDQGAGMMSANNALSGEEVPPDVEHEAAVETDPSQRTAKEVELEGWPKPHGYSDARTMKQFREWYAGDLANALKRMKLGDAALGGAIGAAGVGSAAYILARLLKRKKAWAYGLGGAALGAAGGAYGAGKAMTAISDWLNARRKRRAMLENESLSNARDRANYDMTPGEKQEAFAKMFPSAYKYIAWLMGNTVANRNAATDAAVGSHTENAIGDQINEDGTYGDGSFGTPPEVAAQIEQQLENERATNAAYKRTQDRRASESMNSVNQFLANNR